MYFFLKLFHVLVLLETKKKLQPFFFKYAVITLYLHWPSQKRVHLTFGMSRETAAPMLWATLSQWKTCFKNVSLWISYLWSLKRCSSSYWASVANALNVLQPYWLIVLPLDVPDLTASGDVYEHSYFRMFQLSPLVVFKRSKGGTTWARNDRWILPENARLPRNIQGLHVTFGDLLHAVNLRHGTVGFTSPPKESVLRTFSPWKIQRLLSGLNPRTWVPKASTLPLDHRSRFEEVLAKKRWEGLLFNKTVNICMSPFFNLSFRWYNSFLSLISGKHPRFLWWVYGNRTVCRICA